MGQSDDVRPAGGGAIRCGTPCSAGRPAHGPYGGAALPGPPLRWVTEPVQGIVAARNRAMVDTLGRLAQARGCTPAQLALAWLLHRGPDIVPIPGTRKVSRLDENAAAAGIALSAEDMQAIDAVLDAHPVAGLRYPEAGIFLRNMGRPGDTPGFRPHPSPTRCHPSQSCRNRPCHCQSRPVRRAPRQSTRPARPTPPSRRPACCAPDRRRRCAAGDHATPAAVPQGCRVLLQVLARTRGSCLGFTRGVGGGQPRLRRLLRSRGLRRRRADNRAELVPD